MHNRIIVMSATIIIAIFLTLMLVFSGETVSALTSVNPIGLLAATFAAVIGLAWFVKKN